MHETKCNHHVTYYLFICLSVFLIIEVASNFQFSAKDNWTQGEGIQGTSSACPEWNGETCLKHT